MQQMKHHLCNVQNAIHMLILMNDVYAHAMQVQCKLNTGVLHDIALPSPADVLECNP